MSDADRRRWDDRYTRRGAPAEDAIGLAPVFDCYQDLFPDAGTALDIACGQGGAAVWLARRGLRVRALDVSEVALGHARALARTHGVADRCRFDAVDLDRGLPAGPLADVIYCHKFRDRRLDRAMLRRLAPGGLLAIVALTRRGTDPDPFRVGPGELAAAFAELEPITAGTGDGKAWLLARRAPIAPESVGQTGG